MFALLLFAYASTGSANDRRLVYRYLAKAVDTACFLSAVTKQAVCRDSLTSSPSISVKTNRMYALHTSAFKNCQRYQRCTHTHSQISLDRWPRKHVPRVIAWLGYNDSDPSFFALSMRWFV
jgi:hypothetical protein